MKKVFLVILFFLLLCGCEKKYEESIETIVETNSNIAIAINYPVTEKKLLDEKIESYIKSVYEGFKEEYGNYYELAEISELNIDYKYWKVENKYINVVLYTFINNSSLAHPINEIKTFVFDLEKNKTVLLKNMIPLEKLQENMPFIKNEIITKYKGCILSELLESEITANFDSYSNFTIDNENVTFYFEPYKITSGNCGIIDITVPLEKFDLQSYHPMFNENIKIEYAKQRVIDPNKPVVAITFDDGPSKYTDEIINILNENNANATFFVLGNKVNIYKDTLIKGVLLGNELGNHSYNHKWLTRLDAEEFKSQIDRTQNTIYETIGYMPRLLRPTYGSINDKIRKNTNLQIILWNVDSNDWKIKNSTTIAQKVLQEVEDMDIILFHDTYERTMKAIKIVVPELISKGYQLVTVSELEEVKLVRNRIS